ncbi:MAG: ankyrin repeat domain-containing protein, partial [Leptospirillia bacterium]
STADSYDVTTATCVFTPIPGFCDDGNPDTVDTYDPGLGLCTHTLLDDDGDGVGNSVDLCPGTAAGAVVNADGCSDAQLAATNTPLHDAVIAGNQGAVEKLIEGGADADAKGVDGKSPLHLAAAANNKGIVEILLKNVTLINQVDNFGRTALSYATNSEVQKKLTESGATL